MSYCPRCGVGVPSGAARCPLCGHRPIEARPTTAEASDVDYPPTQAGGGAPSEVEMEADAFARAVRDSLNDDERRKVGVELSAVAFGASLLIAALIDLFIHRAFTWSRFSSVGIALAWLFVAMPMILRGRRWLAYAVLAPSSALAVFLFTAFAGAPAVFLRYGLPISLAVCGVAAGFMGITSAFRRAGLNALAVFLCGVAVFCFAIEAVVDLNAGRLSPDWSVVVAIALVPAAGLLFYLHYRVVDQASLRKLFRL